MKKIKNLESIREILWNKRDFKVDHIRKMDGKEYTIAKDSSVDSVTPFHCKKWDLTMKDSQSFIDHLNGKKHNRNLGMSMYVEKKDISSVKNKLLELKKRKQELEDKKQKNKRQKTSE